MGQYVFDIAELPPEMQIGDQPVLVAGNIEHMQITNLVHAAKHLPQLGEIGIVPDLHHLAPSLQGFAGIGIYDSEIQRAALSEIVNCDVHELGTRIFAEKLAA